MNAPADNTAWRQSEPGAWVDDTSDVLHCSMPPQVRQHIEELRAEVKRATERTQQVEVMHFSAAVLGYSVAHVRYETREGDPWVLTDSFLNEVTLDPSLIRDDILEDNEVHVAVVRVGADGRIGS